jgi:hypothetical protein
LHVLSAPPAFVLSQDQTLREGFVAGTVQSKTTKQSETQRPANSTSSMLLKGRSRRTDEVDNSHPPIGRIGAKHGQSSEIEVSTSKNVRC